MQLLVEEHCTTLYKRIKCLEEQNTQLHNAINDHQSYSRLDNLIFYGLECQSYADAAAGRGEGEGEREYGDPSGEASITAEESVIKLCCDKLGVPVAPSDISIAHHLGGRKSSKTSKKGGERTVVAGGARAKNDEPNETPTAQPIIVRFTSRKLGIQYFNQNESLLKLEFISMST